MIIIVVIVFFCDVVVVVVAIVVCTMINIIFIYNSCVMDNITSIEDAVAMVVLPFLAIVADVNLMFDLIVIDKWATSVCVGLNFWRLTPDWRHRPYVHLLPSTAVRF